MLALYSVQLFPPDRQNLAKVDGVVVFLGVVLLDAGIEEVGRVEISRIDFPALEDEFGLRKAWRGDFLP